MRIALLSDIHANLPALEACLADIDLRKPDLIYCLGDLVGYNCWPNEVVDLIRVRNIPTVAGNYDFGIGRTSDDCGCAYKTASEKEMSAISIAYTNATIKDDQRNFLRSLPSYIRLGYQLNIPSPDLLLVHGSPRRINEYLTEDRGDSSILRIMNDAHAEIMCFGHTHIPYHKKIIITVDGSENFIHAINTGSVGKPKDGDARGCYVMLTLNENVSSKHSDRVEVEFIRFEYDLEKAVSAIKNSSLPDVYADMLINGK